MFKPISVPLDEKFVMFNYSVKQLSARKVSHYKLRKTGLLGFSDHEIARLCYILFALLKFGHNEVYHLIWLCTIES